MTIPEHIIRNCLRTVLPEEQIDTLIDHCFEQMVNEDAFKRILEPQPQHAAKVIIDGLTHRAVASDASALVPQVDDIVVEGQPPHFKCEGDTLRISYVIRPIAGVKIMKIVEAREHAYRLRRIRETES